MPIDEFAITFVRGNPNIMTVLEIF